MKSSPSWLRTCFLPSRRVLLTRPARPAFLFFADPTRVFMPTHCAFLRAINVGGRNKVSMADLKDLFGALKFANVRTLLQSGNVVFDNDGRSDAEVERLLETETEKRLKVTADYFVRTEAELKRIIARNPFPKEAEDDPSHLVVI